MPTFSFLKSHNKLSYQLPMLELKSTSPPVIIPLQGLMRMIKAKRKTRESTIAKCWTYYDELVEWLPGPRPCVFELAHLIQFGGTDSRKGDHQIASNNE